MNAIPAHVATEKDQEVLWKGMYVLLPCTILINIHREAVIMKRRILSILCAIIMLCSAAIAETATVTVDGVGEHVTVTLTMEGDRIKSVEASSDSAGEDARYREALARIAEEMVNANTFSVDAVSGVTCTSNAVIAAAAEAWLQIEAQRMSQEAWMHEVFTYEHDPRDNPKAMKDIVYNPDAVYGFSPSPDSTRLKEYVDAIDWTNAKEVAEARAQRQAYLDSMAGLYRLIEKLLTEGKDVETIARAVSQLRNEIRIESYADDPEGLETVKKSNLETYGDEMGPSADFLYEKYGSWQTVLEKALSTNMGMDACLGFYDELYDYYDLEATVAMAGWKNVPHEAAELPTDAQAAFDAALKGLVGAQYTPVALMSTKADSGAGAHYCILCQITPVVPDASSTWALVYVDADGEGNAKIANVYDLYIERHSTPEK